MHLDVSWTSGNPQTPRTPCSSFQWRSHSGLPCLVPVSPLVIRGSYSPTALPRTPSRPPCWLACTSTASYLVHSPGHKGRNLTMSVLHSCLQCLITPQPGYVPPLSSASCSSLWPLSSTPPSLVHLFSQETLLSLLTNSFHPSCVCSPLLFQEALSDLLKTG